MVTINHHIPFESIVFLLHLEGTTMEQVTITILNWDKYNPKRDQKTYTWFKMQNDFYLDHRLYRLTTNQCYTFITLLAKASQTNSGTYTLLIQAHAKQIRLRTKELQKTLEILKEIGIIDFSYDNVRTNDGARIEKNRINKNKIEQSKLDSSQPQAVRSSKPTNGSLVWNAYAEAYENRYKVKPVRNRTTNSQAKALSERLGVENACEVVRFYLTHNDSFFVRDQHPIGLCLSKAEALHTQWQRGKPVTSIMANQFAKQKHNTDAFDRVIEKLGEMK